MEPDAGIGERRFDERGDVGVDPVVQATELAMLRGTGENRAKGISGRDTETIRDRSNRETRPAVGMAPNEGENPPRTPWDCDCHTMSQPARRSGSLWRLLRSTSLLLRNVDFKEPVGDDGHLGLVLEAMCPRPERGQGENEGAALPMEFSC